MAAANEGERQDLGLRLLTAAVAAGYDVETINRFRAWNREDAVPDTAIDAAYEAGYAAFDQRRSAGSSNEGSA